jgi:hypothetical protein
MLIDRSRERGIVAMDDFLYFCPTCKTIYEIVSHHIRPPAEPVCEGCQQELPIADDGEWLTYRRTRPRLGAWNSVVCSPPPVPCLFERPINAERG